MYGKQNTKRRDEYISAVKNGGIQYVEKCLNSYYDDNGLSLDALDVDYEQLLSEFSGKRDWDYLQLDCEPSKTTFEILLSIPFEKWKFAVITYEHDHYVDMTGSYREKSRRYLKSQGYELVVNDISPNDNSPFEDWWYHPDLIDQDVLNQMKCVNDRVNNVVKYILPNYILPS